MKTKLLTLALLTVALAAFAQGKIILANDSLHLVVFYPDTPIPSQSSFWDGLTMQLWGGTSFGSMTLQTTIVGAAISNPVRDGRITSQNVTLTGVGTGTTATLQLLFFSTAAGSYQNAVSSLLNNAASLAFTATTGSFAFNSIVSHGSLGNSTWAHAPVVFGIPEPSIAALTGLGILVMFRYSRRSVCARRNQV